MATTRKPSPGAAPKHRDRFSPIRSYAERAAAGKALRAGVPRTAHAEGRTPAARDPIDVLERSNGGRLPELVPIRFGRMLQSPFAFLRGSAAVMAFDLAHTPSSGLSVQLCGDCHLLNFGLFATPERRLAFDLNDFDETLPGPWEWDVKRLVASIVVAARDFGLSDAQARDAVLRCVWTYRVRMREFSRLTPLELWYSRIDWDSITAAARDANTRELSRQVGELARKRVAEHLFPKITTNAEGAYRFVDQPPLLFHLAEREGGERVHRALELYRDTLPEGRRVLFDRYRVQDFALKVVGVGSVGTRCYVVLLMSADDHPLILQFKEAGRSVLEPHLGKGRYEHQGERVVRGQQLIQGASDIFLGWTRGDEGQDFYVRQLRDMKASVPLDQLAASQLQGYARLCGRTLSSAHAKSGDSAAIAGYLGRGDRFDQAMAEFAVAYADQTEKDHATLVKAVRSGRVEALADA